MKRSSIIILLLSVIGVIGPASAESQVRPDLDWRTLTTEHFRVHFTAELEPLARRTMWNAERAYSLLSNELVPPRGTIDIVVADNVDYANGFATSFPTNRIVIYARPPVEEMSLRNHEDWNRILVTHELVHIFHLDRVGGIWRGAQAFFGRAAPLFPNSYAPSWVVEGLAVHYESAIGGGGRLAGTVFPMLVRTAAQAGTLPSLDALSLGSPHFPGASIAYVYGSYAMTRADTARMGRFVEASSSRLLPWRHDANSRDAFGISFTDRWAEWRDSVSLAGSVLPPEGEPLGVVNTLTSHGFGAEYPRFSSDGELVYVADDARRNPALYRLSEDGTRRRVGRRNSVDANVPLTGGRTVQGELEWTDSWTLRSDLTRGSGLRRRNMTRGERLSSPDVHEPSGRIVAVRTEPGTTSLVLLNAGDDDTDAGGPQVLVRGTLDLIWSDPRLSAAGERVAAVRWEYGGRTSVVVLDLSGRELQKFAPRGPRISLVASPAWLPGDTALVFVSDHEGRSLVYLGDVRTGEYGRVWNSATGLRTPDVSPDGRRLTAVELRADGYHVVTRAMPSHVDLGRPASDTLPDPLAVSSEMVRGDTAGRSVPFSPWGQLVPTWWLPVVLTTDIGVVSVGGMTSGRDVVGRHDYAAELSFEARNAEMTGRARYSYAGLGNPIASVSLGEHWQHFSIVNTGGVKLGYLGQHTVDGEISALFQRPRVRLGSYLLLGAATERVSFRAYPKEVVRRLSNPAFRQTLTSHALRAQVGFSTMQRPMLAVSAQDGVSASVSHRQRFDAGIQFEDITETVVSGVVAKSLGLPGFAPHVVAVRAAYGVTGHAATTGFGAGGVSGSSLELAPGVVIGSSPRTFGIRGFDGATQLGVRAAAGSAEYRAPLALIGRGVRMLPVFFQKATMTAFADAGAAWCTRRVDDSFICPTANPERQWLASVGTELALDASLEYDVIYRFRLGFARQVHGVALDARENTIYFSLGSAF